MSAADSDLSNVIFSLNDIQFMISGKYATDFGTAPEDAIPVPNQSAYITGICNSFGRIVAMVDLASLLGLSRREQKNEMLIFLDQPFQGIGFLVEKIISTEPLSRLRIMEKNPLVNDFILNIYKNDKLKDVILELNVQKIISIVKI